MGQEKGLLDLGGRPLALWVIERVSEIAEELVVATSPANNSAYRKTVPPHILCVPDTAPDLGPVGGWRSALPALRGEYVAMAPCDAPFYSPPLGRLLFEEAQGHDGAVPKLRGEFEPLHGVYQRTPLQAALERTIAAGQLRPIHTYEHLDIVEVPEPLLRSVDPELESFLNANTPEELTGLRSLATSRRPR